MVTILQTVAAPLLFLRFFHLKKDESEDGWRLIGMKLKLLSLRHALFPKEE